jgi:predicted AAA+ superfamily ATPase
MVERYALQNILKWRDKQVIKVVTGVRRCGKSTLLTLFMEHLKAEAKIKDEQIIFLNLEQPENARLLTPEALYSELKAKLCKTGRTYILIDEIQQCEGFEKAVDGLFVLPNVDIYITGSNAFMLSGELATLLSGRYVRIEMLPLSFAEYLTFTRSAGEAGKDLRRSFDNYLRWGSFPYAAMLNNETDLIREYLEGIYNTILIKDIAKREKITDIAALESIIKFLSHSIGSPISAKKISDTLHSSGRKISVNTVDAFLRALTESYIFYKADRFDIKGRQQLKTLGKYYIVDTGLRNFLFTGMSSDLGHQLENIVYLELRRRGFKVYTGKVGEKEIDFVATRGSETAYYQVAATTLDENTLARELEPLKKTGDDHPKYLLTLDEYEREANYAGIQKMHIIDWLLKNSA